MQRIIEYISVFLALILVLPVHEFAHAFAAVKNGDLTPKLAGRYTLNPLAHFDIIGLCCFVLAGFGWAKPVPINPDNFNNRKTGRFTVAIAGVAANYILAFVFYPVVMLSLSIPQFGYFTEVLQLALFYIVRLSLVFFVFNLIPVYPLDGFMAVDALTKRRNAFYDFLRYKGIYVLYALFALSIAADLFNVPQLDVLGIVINFVVSVIGKPITLFWGLFF